MLHRRHGDRISLINNQCTAVRNVSEYNCGLVFSAEPLKDDEVFEVRIDKKMIIWSGSIEIGVTACDPEFTTLPASASSLTQGSWIMIGSSIVHDGKPILELYGTDLSILEEGNTLGVCRTSKGELVFYVNGSPQGIAATGIPSRVFAVINLYGNCIQVSTLQTNNGSSTNEDEPINQQVEINNDFNLDEVPSSSITNLVGNLNVSCHILPKNPSLNAIREDKLRFHERVGALVKLSNNARSAERRRPSDEFNHAVILTSRPLKSNELFEVRLDKIVTKWAGSIEIGVTTHSPTELEFPFTMTNVRSGTWMMTGNGVMHNGTTMIDQYGQNLDRLQVGDRVGVMRKDNATLHFFVNGVDQGVAATSVPDRVYGVIDLYGQAAQATIVENTDYCSPTTVNSSSISNTTMYSYLRFHHVHGKNARISNNGLTAARPRALSEFNDAIVVVKNCLRDGEIFEVSIDKMVERWSGAIEAGVTAIRPDELEFPSTMTDIDHDTWMLSGSTIMRDGVTIRNNYSCDLDKLVIGNRLGMMRFADNSLHFYLDGVDQGPAFNDLPAQVYPVIDLYGQCAQVTITVPERRDAILQQYLPSENSITSQQPTSIAQPIQQTEVTHKFHESAGLNIQLDTGRAVATRCREYNNAILLSDTVLDNNELFEIGIQEIAREWSGSLRIGLVSNETGSWLTSMNFVQVMTSIPADAWYLTGNQIRHKGHCLCQNYCPNLDWLRVGDKIGLKRTSEGNLKFYINREDMGVAASNVPESCYVIVELFGSTVAVCVTSTKQQNAVVSPSASLRLQDSLELLLDPVLPGVRNEIGMDTSSDTFAEAKLLNDAITPTQATTNNSIVTGDTILTMDWPYEFHENHGRNVQIEKNIVATRIASYNQGIVMTSKPLIKNKMLQIKIEKINDRWVSGLLCGIVYVTPEKVVLPVTALGFKKHSWIVCSEWISHNGIKVRSSYGANLENLRINSTIGLLLDDESKLHLYVDGQDQGVGVADLPNYVYAVIDLYGQCERVSILGSSSSSSSTSSSSTTGDASSNNENEMLVIGETNNAMMERLTVETEDVENSREKADLECHEKENGTVALLDEQGEQSQSEIEPLKHPPVSTTPSSSLQSDTNNTETVLDKEVPNAESVNLESENNVEDGCNSIANLDRIESCSNVELNNATNINIRKNSVINNIGSNANNVINESIASNSSSNNNNNNNNNASLRSWQLNHCAPTTTTTTTTPQDLVLNLHRHSLSSQTQNNSLSNNIINSQQQQQQSLSMHNSIPSTPLATSNNLVNPTTTNNPSKKCEYLKACVRLKNSLVLPEEFFSLDDVFCYCSSCFKADIDTMICKKGEPLAEFAVPTGWVRFSLKHSINANQIPQSTTDKWHVAFYGTRVDTVRSILDNGKLLTREKLDTDWLTIDTINDNQNPQVVFSPNIKWVNSEDYNKQYSYVDVESNKKVNASTAFQLLVKPGSYTMTTTKKDGTDSQMEYVEWATKETGATIIVALLIYLDRS